MSGVTVVQTISQVATFQNSWSGFIDALKNNPKADQVYAAGSAVVNASASLASSSIPNISKLAGVSGYSAAMTSFGPPVRFVRKPATSTKSYTGRVVRVGIVSGFRSVG